MKIVLCSILLLILEATAQIKRYDNYKVYRLTPKSNEEIEKLRQFEDSFLEFDVWKGSTRVNDGTDIMVAPEQVAQFQDIVDKLNIKCDIIIENVQRLIDDSTPKNKNTSRIDWTDYYTIDKINEWLTSLGKTYPTQVKPVIGGRSFEGRDLLGVKVSFKPGNKAVFIEGGIHAREWISPATVTYTLNELLTSTDPEVREVAESYDWYIFPSVNPDGYAYTQSTDRMWRKTRQPHGICTGTDPNRNWAYHWNEGGNTSNNTCAETYAGPFPFSEPETKSLSEYIESIHDHLVGYLSIHSYSQLLLIPYGHSMAHVENFDELLEIGELAMEKLMQRYGTVFLVGNMAEAIYKATGVSPDWVKGNFKIPITYTYELRDTGTYGFVLPPEEIIPSGEEFLDSLVTMMQEAKSRGYY